MDTHSGVAASPALIHLIDTPALKLSTPLGGRIPGPGAVLGPAMVFGVTDFLRGDFQEMLNIIRDGKGRGDPFLTGQGGEREQQQEQKQQGRHASRMFQKQPPILPGEDR